MIIIGETGHQNIPETAREYVSSGLGALLSALQGQYTGVCSLAGGADQEFASLVLGRGCRLYVVVPCNNYEQTFSSEEERERYQSLIARACEVELLAFSQPSEEAYFAAGRRVVDLSDILIAVWDGKTARGLGGTADVVEYARSQGKRIEIVWPSNVQR
jgi:hypothetical protein